MASNRTEWLWDKVKFYGPVISVIFLACALAFVAYMSDITIKATFFQETGTTGQQASAGLANALMFIIPAVVGGFAMVYLFKMRRKLTLKYLFGGTFFFAGSFIAYFFATFVIRIAAIKLGAMDMVTPGGRFFIGEYPFSSLWYSAEIGSSTIYLYEIATIGGCGMAGFLLSYIVVSRKFDTEQKNSALLIIGALMGAFLAIILPTWTVLAMLIGLSLYDIYAVRQGPIRDIVNVAIEEEEKMARERIEKLDRERARRAGAAGGGKPGTAPAASAGPAGAPRAAPATASPGAQPAAPPAATADAPPAAPPAASSPPPSTPPAAPPAAASSDAPPAAPPPPPASPPAAPPAATPSDAPPAAPPPPPASPPAAASGGGGTAPGAGARGAAKRLFCLMAKDRKGEVGGEGGGRKKGRRRGGLLSSFGDRDKKKKSWKEKEAESDLIINSMTYSAQDWELGIGDLVFYSMLSAHALTFATAYVPDHGLFAPFVVLLCTAMGILVGFTITIKLLDKYQMLPGLPIPLTMGITGFLASSAVYAYVI